MAKESFEKSMQGTGICEDVEDPLFQQIYGCYVGTHGTGGTETQLVGRSDKDRYFDDEAYEKEQNQEQQSGERQGNMDYNFYI